MANDFFIALKENKPVDPQQGIKELVDGDEETYIDLTPYEDMVTFEWGELFFAALDELQLNPDTRKIYEDAWNDNIKVNDDDYSDVNLRGMTRPRLFFEVDKLLKKGHGKSILETQEIVIDPEKATIENLVITFIRDMREKGETLFRFNQNTLPQFTLIMVDFCINDCSVPELLKSLQENGFLLNQEDSIKVKLFAAEFKEAYTKTKAA